MVQQLRALQPERQILPESAAQAAPREKTGHLLEVLAGALLPSEEQRDDDGPRRHPEAILERAGATQEMLRRFDVGFFVRDESRFSSSTGFIHSGEGFPFSRGLILAPPPPSSNPLSRSESARNESSYVWLGKSCCLSCAQLRWGQSGCFLLFMCCSTAVSPCCRGGRGGGGEGGCLGRASLGLPTVTNREQVGAHQPTCFVRRVSRSLQRVSSAVQRRRLVKSSGTDQRVKKLSFFPPLFFLFLFFSQTNMGLESKALCKVVNDCKAGLLC